MKHALNNERKYLRCKCGKRIWIWLFDYNRLPANFMVYCAKCASQCHAEHDAKASAEYRAAHPEDYAANDA